MAHHVLETYASMAVLLGVSAVFLKALSMGMRAPLDARLARIVVASCVAAPLVMGLVPPAHGPLLGRAAAAPAVAAKPAPAIMGANATRTASLPSEATTAEPPSDRPSPADVAVSALAALLAASAVFGLARLARDARRIRRLLRKATLLRRRGKVRVLVSEDIHVPFAVRFPCAAYVVLPLEALARPRETLIAVFHEGQHHRQGDCVFAYALELVRALFLWHPAAHWWCRHLSDLQEFSCDEALIGRRLISPHDYGQCLLSVAQAAHLGPGARGDVSTIACVVGMARSGTGAPSILRRRISMLSHYSSARKRRLAWLLLSAGAASTLQLGVAYAARGTLASTETAQAPLDQGGLDPALMPLAESAIRSAMAKYRARSGVIAVADPATGRLVAYAEMRAPGDHGESWATRRFAPGSTVKPFVLAAALEAGTMRLDTVYDCSQPYDVGGTKFVNYEDKFRDETATRILAASVNVGAIKIAQDAGSHRLRETFGAFGIDLDSTWRSDASDSRQLATAALGETVPVSLANLTQAYATLARRGLSPEGEVKVSEATAAAVQTAMLEAVRTGTGKNAAIAGVAVAGKTGTVVAGTNARKQDQQASHLALFAGYAPAAAPKYVTVVVLEDARRTSNGEKVGGGASAAYVFREFMEGALRTR